MRNAIRSKIVAITIILRDRVCVFFFLVSGVTANVDLYDYSFSFRF